MKSRSAFNLSLAFVFVALAFRLAALGQFQEGYQQMRDTHEQKFPADYSSRGNRLLFLSFVAAFATLICLFVSRKRQERARRWITFTLLVIYILVSCAPA